MNSLADLPNHVGFEFTAILKDDSRMAAKVVLHPDGYHTTDIDFKELKGWLKT
jgi:hypothetical protein